MRWNPDTDYIQILKDNEWVDYKLAGLLTHYLFKNGEFMNEATGAEATNYRSSPFATRGDVVNTTSVSYENGKMVLTMTVPSSNTNYTYHCGTVFISPSINFYKLGVSKIKVNYSTVGTDGNYDARAYLAKSKSDNFSYSQELPSSGANVSGTYEFTKIVDSMCYIAFTLNCWHYSGQTNTAKLYIDDIVLEFN